jgi:phage terminase large subunit GpA-like protein
VATSTFKAETYRFLRQDRPEASPDGDKNSSPGLIHLPGWSDAEWLKQLTAEQLVTVKTKRGFQKLEWQKLRERNEALDCRVYARAAAWILGADRWSEARWAELAAQLQATPSQDASIPASRRAVAPLSKPVRRRRAVRSSYMG